MLDLKYLSITELEAEAFCSILAAYLPSEIVRHGGNRDAVDKMLALLDELASPEVAGKRAERFGISDPKLLFERKLFQAGHRVVIAGLRFRKLNPAFPFVQLCANFHVSRQDLLALKEKVAATFSPIPLKGITLRHPPNFFSDENHEKWSHLVYGSTVGVPCAAFPSGLRAQWGGAIDFYAEYEKEFQKFLTDNPDKEAYLSLEEEEGLKKAADSGLLMSLWDEKGWVGVIAAKRKELYGFPCAYIFEIFLGKRMRGRGMGRALQAHFLAGISDRLSYVFGHISDANRPSLRTALSLGRRVMETEYFFPVEAVR